MLSSINVNIRSSATIFKSKVVYEQSKVPLTDFEKSYIDRFEEGMVDDARYLGEGVTAKAYYLPSCNFVIKQNKNFLI